MNNRIFKKLCKKAALIIGVGDCCKDADGVWCFVYYDNDGHPDLEEAWTFAVIGFDQTVNAEVANGVLTWKAGNKIKPSTAINVLKWLRGKYGSNTKAR